MDADAVSESMRGAMDAAMGLLSTWGINVIGAIALLIVGRIRGGMGSQQHFEGSEQGEGRFFLDPVLCEHGLLRDPRGRLDRGTESFWHRNDVVDRGRGCRRSSGGSGFAGDAVEFFSGSDASDLSADPC